MVVNKEVLKGIVLDSMGSIQDLVHRIYSVHEDLIDIGVEEGSIQVQKSINDDFRMFGDSHEGIYIKDENDLENEIVCIGNDTIHIRKQKVI